MILAVKTRDVLCEVDRLELDALVAPVLRSASEKTLARRVAVTDADGNVIRYATGREVLKGLAKVQELEHVVGDGVRPKTIICKNCGALVPVRTRRGAVPTRCGPRCHPQASCATDGCDRTPPESAFEPSSVRRRGGRPWVCILCHGKALAARLTTEQLSENGRRSQAQRSREEKTASARRGRASMKKEDLDAHMRRMSDAARLRRSTP